jgi:hypothetical protein
VRGQKIKDPLSGSTNAKPAVRTPPLQDTPHPASSLRYHPTSEKAFPIWVRGTYAETGFAVTNRLSVS